MPVGRYWDYDIAWEEPDSDFPAIILTNPAARQQAGGFLIAHSQTRPEISSTEPITLPEGYYHLEEKQVLFAWIGEQLATLTPFALGYRNAPGDDCQVQFTVNGGTTWTNAWRTDLCAAPTQADAGELSAIISEGQTYLTNIHNTFINGGSDPGVLDPDAPTDTFNGSAGDTSEQTEWRTTALCDACEELIMNLCQSEIARRGGEGTFLVWVFGAIAVVFPPAAILAIAAGLLALTFEAVSSEIINDESQQRGAACCMYNALKGVSLTKAAFESSLDGCSEWAGTDISQLTGAIAGTLQGEGIYEMFVKALGLDYRFAKAGLVDCGCDCIVLLEATGAGLVQLTDCEYRFTLPVQAAEVNITRVGGGAFTVIDWQYTNDGWTAQGTLASGGGNIEMNWPGQAWTNLKALAARDFPITITFSVVE